MRSPEFGVGKNKTAWFNNIEWDIKTGAKSNDCSRILGNIWLKEC
jgi:hypothetical protein